MVVPPLPLSRFSISSSVIEDLKSHAAYRPNVRKITLVKNFRRSSYERLTPEYAIRAYIAHVCIYRSQLGAMPDAAQNIQFHSGIRY